MTIEDKYAAIRFGWLADVYGCPPSPLWPMPKLKAGTERSMEDWRSSALSDQQHLAARCA